MEKIDFKQLKRLWNLKLVVDTGSIKKAAVHANVTSSAVSQSITTLEQELGRKLLFRKREQILPTEFGLQLLGSAAPAFNVCFDLQKNLSGPCALTPKIEWLDFAAAESLAADVLPGIIRRLRLRFPDIRLKIKSGRSDALTQLVRKGEMCMALVEDNDFMEGVTVTTVGEDRLGFFCANQFSTAKDTTELFNTLGLGTLAPGAGGHPFHFTQLMKCFEKPVKPILSSESYELLRVAAVEGSVIAVLPTRVARRRKGELVEIFPPAGTKFRAAGKFKVHLVSEVGCTAQENALLASEIKSLLASKEVTI